MSKPGEKAPKKEISFSTYFEKDACSSVALYTEKYTPANDLTLSISGGISTNYEGKTALVVEGKWNYYLHENISAQFRLRNSFSEDTSTTHIRFSPSFHGKIAQNTSVYLNPYIATKVNYDDKNCKIDYGAFAGITQGLGKNIKLSLEGQRYRNSWGANVIATFNF